MQPEAMWLLTIFILRPRAPERHPTVEFPTFESCWRTGLDVFEHERQWGVISGFLCKPKPP